MVHIDELLEGGGNFIIERSEGGASFSPASDRYADLQSFQTLVRRLREREGDGYRIHLEHETSDRSERIVDLVMVAIEQPVAAG